MSSFTVATSFPENCSSGFAASTARLFVPGRGSSDPKPTAARLGVAALLVELVVADQLERDVQAPRVVPES